MVVVSLLTKEPSEEILNEFETAKDLAAAVESNEDVDFADAAQKLSKES